MFANFWFNFAFMDYNEYRYIYAPRTEHALLSNDFKHYDNNEYMGEVKVNGSRCMVYMNETQTIIKNRHNDNFTYFKIDVSEFRKLYRGKGWMCLDGEYLNKNKYDETGKQFNLKFVIFDIIIFNGEYLLGISFENRFDILKKNYEISAYNKYLSRVGGSDTVFIVNLFYEGFSDIFKEIEQFGDYKLSLYEGLVLKKRKAGLEPGYSEKNNTNTQFKFRREDNFKNRL